MRHWRKILRDPLPGQTQRQFVENQDIRITLVTGEPYRPPSDKLWCGI
jgi:hypothetical protein